MAVDVRGKACAYLRNGQVTVHTALREEGDGLRVPYYVIADVVGHSSTYLVRLDDGVWTCTCGKPESCAHVGAVQLVTGHPGVARKADKP